MKILVGNKIDLEEERKVSTEEARELAKMHKMPYFEASAKLNRNIDELMQELMEEVYKKMFNDPNDDVRAKSVILRGKDQPKKNGKDGGKKGCC